jgi:hypothetical protein
MSRFLTACGAALLISTTLSATSAIAAPAAARVLFVSGDAERVTQDGRTHALLRGDSVFNGDLIQTRKGIAQLEFGHGGLVSVQIDSRCRIAEYFYGGQEDGTEHAIFELLKGGIRALSGAIGHQRRERCQMRTTVATIGIRGTAYSALFCQRDCAIDGGVTLPDGLHAKTTEGAIVLQNEAGALAVPAGAAAFVPGQFSIPVPSTFAPSFARAEPGGTPQQVNGKEAEQSTVPAADNSQDDATAAASPTDATKAQPTLVEEVDRGKLEQSLKQDMRDFKTVEPSPIAGDGKGPAIELPAVPVLIDNRMDRDSMTLQPQLSPDLFNNNDLDRAGSGKLLKEGDGPVRAAAPDAAAGCGPVAGFARGLAQPHALSGPTGATPNVSATNATGSPNITIFPGSRARRRRS